MGLFGLKAFIYAIKTPIATKFTKGQLLGSGTKLHIFDNDSVIIL